MGHNGEKNRVRLKICDMECTVSTEDQEEYVRELGKDVQRTIQGFLGQNNGRVSLAMAATIAALTYCDEYQKETANSDNLRTQIKQYCDEAIQVREEAERLQVENEKLRADLDALHAECSRLKMQLEAADSAWQAKNQLEQKRGQREAEVDDEPVEEILTEEPEEQTPQDEAQESAPKAHAIPRPIPPQAPLRRNEDEAPVQAGPYTRPKSPFEPDLPNEEGFVSFFEKK